MLKMELLLNTFIFFFFLRCHNPIKTGVTCFQSPARRCARSKVRESSKRSQISHTFFKKKKVSHRYPNRRRIGILADWLRQPARSHQNLKLSPTPAARRINLPGQCAPAPAIRGRAELKTSRPECQTSFPTLPRWRCARFRWKGA